MSQTYAVHNSYTVQIKGKSSHDSKSKKPFVRQIFDMYQIVAIFLHTYALQGIYLTLTLLTVLSSIHSISTVTVCCRCVSEIKTADH